MTVGLGAMATGGAGQAFAQQALANAPAAPAAAPAGAAGAVPTSNIAGTSLQPTPTTGGGGTTPTDYLMDQYKGSLLGRLPGIKQRATLVALSRLGQLATKEGRADAKAARKLRQRAREEAQQVGTSDKDRLAAEIEAERALQSVRNERRKMMGDMFRQRRAGGELQSGLYADAAGQIADVSAEEGAIRRGAMEAAEAASARRTAEAQQKLAADIAQKQATRNFILGTGQPMTAKEEEIAAATTPGYTKSPYDEQMIELARLNALLAQNQVG